MSFLDFIEQDKRQRQLTAPAQPTQTDVAEPLPEQPERPPTGPLPGFGDFINQQLPKRNPIAEAAASVGAGKAAEALQLSRETGLPPDVVLRQQDTLRAQEEARKTVETFQTRPGLMAAMRDPAAAALLMQDREALAQMEDAVRATGRIRYYPQTVVSGAMRGVQMTAGGAAELGDVLRGAARDTIRNLAGERAANILVPETPASLDVVRLLRLVEEGYRGLADVTDVSEEVRGFDTDVAAAVGQLGVQIAAALVNPAAGATMFTMQGADIMAEKVEDDDAPVENKRLATVAGGAITGITQKLSIDRILGPAGAKIRDPLLRFLAGVGTAAGAEAAQEITENILMDVTRIVLTNPEADIELADALYEGGVAGTAAALVRVALGLRPPRRMAQEQEAVQELQRLQELTNLAAQVQLREADPQTFQELMQGIAQDSGQMPTEFYASAQEVAAVLEQAGLSVEEVLPSVAEALAAEAAYDGQVAIPVGEILTNVVGSPAQEALLQIVRASPDSLSLAELRQAGEQAEQLLMQEAQRVIDEAADSAVALADRDAVQDAMVQQLEAAGRFTPDVNTAYATLVANFYATLGARLGTSAQDMYSRFPLRVEATGQVAREQALERNILTGWRAFVEPTLVGEIDAAVANPPVAAEPSVDPAARAEAEAALQPMLARAQEAKPGFDAAVRQIAQSLQGEAKIPGLKGVARAAEKTVLEYQGDATQVRDLLRATLIVDSPAQVEAAIAAVEGQFNVLRTKNRFTNPTPAGYRDVLMNVGLDNGTIAEIQINVPEMVEAKSIGHKLYRVARSQEGSETAARMNELQTALHDAAWAALNSRNRAMSAAASSAETGEPSARAREAGYGSPLSARMNEPSASETTYTPSTSSSLAPGGMLNISGPPSVPIVPEATINDTLEQAVSTRVPTAVKALENPLTDRLVVGTAPLLTDPKAAEKVAGVLRGYNNLRPGPKTPKGIIEKFVRHVTDNLLWLHDNVPADLRNRSKLWYDGARAITERWVPKYEGAFSDAQIAGVLAVLSPQTDWFMNVSRAERMLDIWTQQQETRWSVEMDATAERINGLRNYQEALAAIQGRTLGELTDPVHQAMWMRVFDETHNPRTYRVVTPEGDFTETMMTGAGQPALMAWAHFGMMAKAISIMQDGSPENISAQLGTEHKVRSFYNNIFSPNDPVGDVTIDTHAVAAGLLIPASGKSTEVTHNFGAGFGSSVLGLSGTYGVYAEAYRRAAAQRALLPREMQSITWEAVRGLFRPGFKAQQSNQDAVAAVWAEYRRGAIDEPTARQRIFDLAGGIEPPAWAARPDRAASAERWTSSYAGELLASGGPVGAAGRGDGSQPAAGAAQQPGDLTDGQPEPQGSRSGRTESGSLAPLPGAPSIVGATGPDPRLVTVAEQYAASVGLNLRRQAQYVQVDEDRARRIAQAYDEMEHAPQDPRVREAYEDLIRQTVDQYRALEAAGYRFYLIDETNDPYGGNPWNAMRDLRANQTMAVFATEAGFGSGATELNVADNPLLADTGISWPYGSLDGPPKRVLANDLFRAVHDAFGHGLEGAGFRAQGEENAWQAHVRLFTGPAVGAITSETRGQNSWLNFGPFGEANRTAKVEDTVFADQKTGLMPEWTWTEGRAPDTEGVFEQAGSRPVVGVHYSQTRRQVLDGNRYGTGLRGAEWRRVEFADDARLRQRVYLYIDEGSGTTPETGVGRVAHEVDLGNIYDLRADPDRLWDPNDLNGSETRLLDAGYSGYYVRGAFGQQGAAVLLGPSAVNVPAREPVLPQSMAEDMEAQAAFLTERAQAAGFADIDTFAAQAPDAFAEAAQQWRAMAPAEVLTQTDTPEFRAWFGDSKAVVAVNAETGVPVVSSREPRRVVPQVMYHTTRSDFSEFEVGRLTANSGTFGSWETQRFAIFVTPSVEDSQAYATQGEGFAPGANVMPLYVRAESPLDLTAGVSEADAARLEAAGMSPRYINSTLGRWEMFDGEDGASAVEIIKAAGFDSVIFNDSNPDTGDSFEAWALFSPEQIKSAIGNVGAFDPNNPSVVAQQARGTYQPSAMTIRLLERADLSTFLHETGHFFLDVLGRVASMPNAPADIQQDMGVLLKWFGVQDLDTWNGMTLDQQRPHHEKFAQTFEAYLFEGKAPSQELRTLFGKFRAWLTNVYKSMQGFMSQNGLSFTPEVTAVMDRLLATEQQIDEAQQDIGFEALFKAAESAGMTPQEWAQFQSLNAQAREEALARLGARSLRDLKWTINARGRELKRLQSEVADKRKAMRDEVTAEVRQEPVFAVQRFLRTGVMPDGERAPKVRLSRQILIDLFGDGADAAWRNLPPAWLSNNPEAVHPDMVASLFGFRDSGEMIRQIEQAFPEASEIEGRTERRLLERYGDLVTPEGVAAAANEAVHNEARARSLATELKALSAGQGKVNVLLRAAKHFGQQVVARRRVRDLKPSEFVNSERRASRKAQQAMAAGDSAAAQTAKRDQLLNHYAARAALDARSEVDRALDYLRKFEKDSVRKRLPIEYQDQIDKLLERVDLRRSTTLREVDRRKSLAAWIEQQEQLGIDPLIPDSLREDSQLRSYRDMTVEEFRGLVDAVRNIEHLGRLKTKLLTLKEEREFAAVVGEINDAIYANVRQRRAARVDAPTPLQRGADLGRNFLSMHRKLASYARQIDGGQDNGPMWRYFVRGMNEASDRETLLRERATLELDRVMRPLYDMDLKHKVFVPEINADLSLEGRLSIALNWGNEQNRQRLLSGENWTEAQVMAIMRTLTPQQLQAVNDVWAYLDTWWPEVAAKEERTTGVRPERVDAVPFSAVASDGTTVDMRGGYYPIKYDPMRSGQAEAQDVAQAARDMMRGAFTRATTRRGHTKARAETVENRPLAKGLGTVFQHINEVTHDLAWHEWLIDANRIVKAIDPALRETLGPEVATEFRKNLEDIAAGDIPASNALESSLAWLRNGATVAGMGWNIVVSLMQPTGLSQSASRIGSKWMLAGVGRWLGNAARMEATIADINAKSNFMRLRSKTLNREINEIRNRIGKPGRVRALQPVTASFFYTIAKLQLVADVPTWLGQYEKSIAAGATEADAIAQADQAVRDSQGGGTISDLSRVQRGGQLQRLFTNFYSYFNTTLNLTAEAYRRTRWNNPTDVAFFAADLFLLYVVPSVLVTLLKHFAYGDDDDELAEKLVRDQASFVLGTLVGVRELGATVSGFAGYEGPTGTRFFSDMAKLAKATEKSVSDEEFTEQFFRRLNSAAGVLLHYPAGQVDRTVRGFVALKEGDTENPLALLFGPPKEK